MNTYNLEALLSALQSKSGRRSCSSKSKILVTRATCRTFYRFGSEADAFGMDGVMATFPTIDAKNLDQTG
jgi:hypothetical protein